MAGTTSTTISLTRREAAEFGGTTLNAVEKAIEQRVLREAVASGRDLTRRALDEGDVAVLVLIGGSPVRLPVSLKRRVGEWVREVKPQRRRARERPAELPLSDTLVLRYTKTAAARVDAAKRYAEARDRLIEVNPEIKGGEPVIRGTRLGVRAVADRLEAGEVLESLIEDYPEVAVEAFEVARVYAKTHPPRGRPARPWVPA